MDRALVTGATGFVGAALMPMLPAPAATLSLGAPDWAARLGRCDLAGATIFHLAARVHEAGAQDESAFLFDNAGKTRALAEAAAKAGARRLVFLSTIKVLGEESPGRPFRIDDPPAPQDAYARSKRAAEEALARIAASSGLEVRIIRPPLVYGPRPAGNLAALLRLADGPWPLPFAALDARRSFVHRDDLARLLVASARRPGGGVRIYHAAHRRSVAARELLVLIRSALGRPARLFPMAPWLLEALAGLAGQRAKMQRLTRSLECDAAEAARELEWTAQVSIEQAVGEMVRAYLAGGRP